MRKWNHRGRNTDPRAGDLSQLRADMAQVQVQVQEEECRLGTRGSVNAGADEEMVEIGFWSGSGLTARQDKCCLWKDLVKTSTRKRSRPSTLAFVPRGQRHLCRTVQGHSQPTARGVRGWQGVDRIVLPAYPRPLNSKFKTARDQGKERATHQGVPRSQAVTLHENMARWHTEERPPASLFPGPTSCCCFRGSC